MNSVEGPAKILVVDDEPDLELLIRQRFRHKIRGNELAFEFAGNGVEALKNSRRMRMLTIWSSPTSTCRRWTD